MNVRKLLKSRPLLFDGAFGTYYASRRCGRYGKYEESNLTEPETVRQIAEEYLAAGCDAVKTNTFGANRASLDCGSDHLRRVILAGCAIAKEAAGPRDAAVFADIGPLPPESENASEQYRELVDLFLEGGVKDFLFETMSDEDGLREASAYIREKSPESYIIVTFAVTPDGFTSAGKAGKELLLSMDRDANVDAVGFNCVSGPYHLLQQIEALPPLKKTLCVSPNSSYPTVADGIASFASNPRYFAHTMMDIFSAGAGILGGCCGTTPGHIHALRQLLAVRDRKKVVPAKRDAVKQDPITAAEDSRFWSKLQAGETVFAAELDPPAPKDIDRFLRYAKTLTEGGADTLTLADCPVARVRTDSAMIAAKLKRELGIDPLPHMNCRDRNINAAKALLQGLSIEGVHNVLAVTGDPIPNAERSEVKGVWSFHSAVLAQYIRRLSAEGSAAEFHVWGALNVNAPNFSAELSKARRKEDAGMVGFLTQPICTDRAAENLARARSELRGYLLGGLLPITSYRAAAYMNSEVAGIVIPEEILALYRSATKEEACDLAVELCSRIGREIRPSVDGYYIITPDGRPSVVCRIIQALKKE